MHLAWDHDQRPAWQVYLSFSAGAADPLRFDRAACPPGSLGQGDAGQLLKRTILETGKAQGVRVVAEDAEVAVSLRIKAASRSEAIPDAYHLVRVAARVASCPLLGEVRQVDGFRWPPPVAGGS